MKTFCKKRLSFDEIFLVPNKEGIDGPNLSPQVGIAGDIFPENGVDGIQIEELVKDELLQEDEIGIRLTKRGVDISNYVFEKFLF